MKELTETEFIDPFDDRPEVTIFRKWLTDNEKEFTDYNLELSHHKQIPTYMYKSADKFILRGLHAMKEGKIEKPATNFFVLVSEVRHHFSSNPFVNMIWVRMEENIRLLESFKNPKHPADKEMAKKELKERGFI